MYSPIRFSQEKTRSKKRRENLIKRKRSRSAASRRPCPRLFPSRAAVGVERMEVSVFDFDTSGDGISKVKPPTTPRSLKACRDEERPPRRSAVHSRRVFERVEEDEGNTDQFGNNTDDPVDFAAGVDLRREIHVKQLKRDVERVGAAARPARRGTSTRRAPRKSLSGQTRVSAQSPRSPQRRSGDGDGRGGDPSKPSSRKAPYSPPHREPEEKPRTNASGDEKARARIQKNPPVARHRPRQPAGLDRSRRRRGGSL